MLHSRSRSGDGIRAAPEESRRPVARRSLHRDARVLRKTPHDGGLEGLYQRSASGRQLPHQRRSAPRARASARHQCAGSSDRDGVSRSAEPAIHRRSDRVGRDRRAHDGEPESSAACIGSELPDWLQERHRRRRAGRGGCDRRGAREPRVHGHDEDGHGRDLRNARQRRLPCDPARRHEGAELRCGECGGGMRRIGQARPARASDDRLLACQLEQVASASGGRRAGYRAATGSGRAAHHRRDDREPSGRGASGSQARRAAQAWRVDHRCMPGLDAERAGARTACASCEKAPRGLSGLSGVAVDAGEVAFSMERYLATAAFNPLTQLPNAAD
ncbi:protein of unknown function (plasmid) [Caballeronia sp. S22]